jgi:VCBS repeat-containing protein
MAIIDGTAQGVADNLTGTSSGDKIRGFSGDDVLIGLGGDDTLIGGAGSDVLDGGSGIDRFEFSAGHLQTGETDYIIDFLTGTDILKFLNSGNGQVFEVLDVTYDKLLIEEFNGVSLQNDLQLYEKIYTVRNSVTGAQQTIVLLDQNAAPVIGDGSQVTGGVTETGLAADDTTPVSGPSTASGTMVATDADSGATLTWSTDAGAADSVYGSFAITAAGVWTYTLDNAAADSLAEGASATETFTVTVTDEFGANDTETVTITITGTNDAPVIAVGGADTASAIIAETNAGLTASGSLTVTDADSSDTVISSVSGVVATGTTGGLTNTALLAMLSVSPASGLAADTGDANNLVWNFNSGSQAFNFLNVGQSLVLTYTVTSTDTFGANDTETVTITITGTIPCDNPTVFPDNVLVGDGVQTEVELVGDVEVLGDCDGGGDDTITGAANALKNLIYGDAYEMLGDATGGDDLIIGGVDTESNVYTNTPWLFGNFLYGDAFSMTDNTVGGNDTMTGGANSLWNYIRGDAYQMSGSAQGGNDVLNGGVGTTYARLYGDASSMSDNSVGGNDTLTGTNGADRNLLIGDAFEMNDNTVGGNDKLYGGDNVNTGFYGYDLMYGDALDASSVGVAVAVRGGNDILEAGDNSYTYMLGDFDYVLSGAAFGGDDLLIGGGAGATQFTAMYGDATQVFAGSTMTGGNDRLVSGSGTDYMYGDFYIVEVGATGTGGSDTFVFSATNNGDDYVIDFEIGKDKLEFVGLTLGDLTLTDDGTDSSISWTDGSVYVYGVTAAALANDFLFT